MYNISKNRLEDILNRYLERIILSKKSTFTKTENFYAEYFLKLDDEILNKTISNVAEETESSTASIFKFIKKLGFKGYKDFQLNLATNINKNSDDSLLTAITSVNENDSPDEIANKIMAFNIQSMYTLKEDIKNIPFESCLNLIKKSKKIHFFGMGGSATIAYDSYHKFLRTKYMVNYVQDYHMQLSACTKMDQNDCIFVFSHSGRTLEAIEVSKVAKKNKAKIIALTGNPKSEMVKISDEAMILPSIESEHGTESLNARILYLTVMDILLISLMYDNVEENKKYMKKRLDALKVTKK